MTAPETKIHQLGTVEEIRLAATATDPRVLHSSEFVASFRPPDYLLDGVLQRGFLYSATGQTGTGKTAISLRLLAHAAMGRPLAGREMQQSRALMLVGENADDVRARWIALGEQMGFLPSDMDVHFVPSIFSVSGALPALKQRAIDLGGIGFVVVDTSAAYFEGEEENSNKQLGDHARALRGLTDLDGRPCVIANCHPTKGATEEHLLPRGGGAFLAEVDGNLTVARKEGIVELHWAGKFRGPDFDSIPFDLATIRTDLLRDSRGRHVPTVIARPLSHEEQAAQASSANRDLHRLIDVMAEKPGASIAELAQAAGWIGAGSVPMRSKVQRLLGDLKRDRLATKGIDHWELTAAGSKLAKKAEK